MLRRSIVTLVGITLLAVAGVAMAQPTTTTYQGQLLVSGSPYSGAANFKFAIIAGAVNAWSNDGTVSGQPAQAVALTVTSGIFTVRLGDTTIPGMTAALTADLLTGITTPLLRAWVSTGGGYTQLTDVPLTSSPFALATEVARRANNGFKVTGDLEVFNASNKRTMFVDAAEGTTGAMLLIYDVDVAGNPKTSIEFDSREGPQGGMIRLFNGAEGGANPNQATVEIDGGEGTGPGQIVLYDNQGNVAIEIDAEETDGYSRVTTDVVQITGGMDLSENFPTTAAAEIEPGMVVSIASDESGGIMVSQDPYDRKVAGIVSGAGGVRTGMILGQSGSALSGDHPVALSGRVYCWADASYGPIQPGDLLTTSATPGHAMRVSNHDRAQGAVLGKAMTSLRTGKGLVLVLVSLQ
jgi:hypothetical protein